MKFYKLCLIGVDEKNSQWFYFGQYESLPKAGSRMLELQEKFPDMEIRCVDDKVFDNFCRTTTLTRRTKKDWLKK